MRKLFFTLFLLVTLSSFGQNPLTYSLVIQQDSTSAQNLYDITRNWFSKEYVNSQAVLQNDNPGKEISGKAKIVFNITNLGYSGMSGFISYFIDIQFKDNRLKLTMTDFYHDPARTVMYDNQMGLVIDSLPDDLKTLGGRFEKSSHRMYYKAFWKRAKPACDDEFNKLSKNLAAFIKTRQIDKKKDNW